MQIDDLAQTPARKGGQKAVRPPITANPAFPWVVALWFAALLGIGSLIVPATLLDSIIAATGLAAIVPMAAPPLGFTAKALIAAVGTLAGGALGLFLARKIVAPQATKARPRKTKDAIGEAGHEEDMHDDLSARAVSGRRRALAIDEEEGQSDFLTVAPLPGVHQTANGPLHVSSDIVPESVIGAADKEDAHYEEVDEPRQVFQPAPPVAETLGHDDEPLELEEWEALCEEDASHALVSDETEPARQEFIPSATAQKPVIAVKYTEVPEARATAKEPLPFSPPSMARIEDALDDVCDDAGFAGDQTILPEEDAGPESEDTVSDKQTFHGPDVAEHDIAGESFEAAAMEEKAMPNRAESDEESDSEGLVQLVQRLGSTLEKHREWAAEKATTNADFAAPVSGAAEQGTGFDTSAEHQPVPDEFDPAAAEDVSQAMAAYFGAPSAAPADTAIGEEREDTVHSEVAAGEDAAAFSLPTETAAPRQRYESFRGTIAAVDLDDEDGEDEDALSEIAAPFALPLTTPEEPAPAPRPAFDQPPPSAGMNKPPSDAEFETDEEEPLELGEYPANPFKRNSEEFVRVEEPEPEEGDTQPAVLFPNQQAGRPAAASAPLSTQDQPSAQRAFDRPAGDAAAAQRAERPRPSNDDNHRALREALMNLQRMGK